MTNSVLDVSSVEAISRALKVNRNDFVNAFKSVRASMEKDMRNFLGLSENLGIYAPTIQVKPKVQPKIKPKVKPKVKTKVKTSTSKKPIHKASTPKPKTPRKPRSASKNGRKSKHASGMTLVQAVAKVIHNNPSTPMNNSQVTEAVKNMGFKSNSIGVQVSQSFGKLLKQGHIVKVNPGLYSVGKPMPVVVVEQETVIESK